MIFFSLLVSHTCGINCQEMSRYNIFTRILIPLVFLSGVAMNARVLFRSSIYEPTPSYTGEQWTGPHQEFTHCTGAAEQPAGIQSRAGGTSTSCSYLHFLLTLPRVQQHAATITVSPFSKRPLQDAMARAPSSPRAVCPPAVAYHGCSPTPPQRRDQR